MKSHYNTTQLDPVAVFERHVYHRDQFAHYLRWTHVLKVIPPKATILDVGCGTGNLLSVLYHNRHTPYYYLGVDVRTKTIKHNSDKFANLPWAEFRNVDFCQPGVKQLMLPEKFEYVTCFEVLEHIGKENGDQFIANLTSQMGRDSVLLISTPCYNGVDVADNHVINGEVGEYTYNEMKYLLEKFFTITGVWGTFASQRDYVDQMTVGQKLLWDGLNTYYDSNLMSVIFAPMFPEQSRNCLWECKLK